MSVNKTSNAKRLALQGALMLVMVGAMFVAGQMMGSNLPAGLLCMMVALAAFFAVATVGGKRST